VNIKKKSLVSESKLKKRGETMETSIKKEKEKWLEKCYQQGIEKSEGYKTLSGIPMLLFIHQLTLATLIT